jgi:hypothetical protein
MTEESPPFVLDEALSAVEAPDRVYRSTRTGRLLKVRVREKTGREVPHGAQRFGRGYFRVTASHCGEDGKAIALDDSHRIGSGVNLTTTPGSNIAADFEAKRIEAMIKADAEADSEDSKQAMEGVRR